MTAACGGGTSAPKVGVAAVVDYTSGLLGAIFAAYDLTWLIPVIPFVGLAPLTLNTFCASDPPTVPTFTQAEVDAMLKLQFGADFDSGISKTKDLVLNTIWFDACQCTSGALVPLVPPTQPAGSITTVFPSPATTAPCSTFSFSSGIDIVGSVDCADQCVWKFFDPAGTLLTPTYTYTVHLNGALNVAVPIPATAESMTLDVNSGACGSFFRGGPTSLPGGATTAFLHMSEHYDAGTNRTQRRQSIDFYCNGQLPNATQTSCCPPDPATSATLTAILDLVKSIQRNYAPLGYTLGAVHAGLTSTGSIPVSRLIGAKVEITAHPSSNQVLPGNPNYVKDMGWMSVSEVDGMIQERRVSQLGFTWFPQLMPIADHVNYEFFPGVVATITEIVPEA